MNPMNPINSAQQAGGGLLAALGRHALAVWQDPGFRATLKSEAWQFFANVASEARAASLRCRG